MATAGKPPRSYCRGGGTWEGGEGRGALVACAYPTSIYRTGIDTISKFKFSKKVTIIWQNLPVFLWRKSKSGRFHQILWHSEKKHELYHILCPPNFWTFRRPCSAYRRTLERRPAERSDEGCTKLCSHLNVLSAKGQLISECPFWNFKFSKNPPKNLTDFCPRI